MNETKLYKAVALLRSHYLDVGNKNCNSLGILKYSDKEMRLQTDLFFYIRKIEEIDKINQSDGKEKN